MEIVRRFAKTWKIYRYRFVPWMKINVTPQKLMACVEDKVVTDEDVMHQLIEIFNKLNSTLHSNSNEALNAVAGFQLVRKKSQVKDAGVGVFVSKGKVSKGQVVAIYPGTVYFPSDVIFFQSLLNCYVFRCIDNIHIDGKNTGISKYVYKSCSQRDRIGFHSTSDMSWLNNDDKQLVCPLNIGQFVNNKSKHYCANVQYQELNIMHDFPLELRKFLPNVTANGLYSVNYLRTIVLVALREISAGEEVFSNYFTFTQT